VLVSIKEIPSWPIINLCVNEHAEKDAVAAFACAALSINLNVLRASDIPLAVAEREALIRLWEREVALSNSALLLNYDEPDNNRAVLSFIENVHSMLILSSREPLRLLKRQAIRLDVKKPSAAEQHSLWQEALGSIGPQLNGQLEMLVSQFNLNTQGIHAASAQVLREGLQGQEDNPVGPKLWIHAIQARPRLDDLAQRIEPIANWSDLVLPEAQIQTLHLPLRFGAVRRYTRVGDSHQEHGA
jgi:hypothetical protein